MLTAFLRYVDPVVVAGFRLHDFLSALIGQRYQGAKRLILIVAHASLVLLFVPSLAVFRKDAGELAANLLIVILFLSPLATLFRMRLLLLLMGLRRELGILMGYLALVHGLGYLRDPFFVQTFFQERLGATVFFVDTSLLAGLGGLILITLLLVTSNTLANRVLGGKHWKLLHRLVYLAFFLIVIHRFFQVGGSWQHLTPFLEAFILVGSYLSVKLLVWKPDLWPWLGEMRAWVSARYTTYQGAK